MSLPFKTVKRKEIIICVLSSSVGPATFYSTMHLQNVLFINNLLLLNTIPPTSPLVSYAYKTSAFRRVLNKL
jgi:hypothetical protein